MVGKLRYKQTPHNSRGNTIISRLSQTVKFVYNYNHKTQP